MILGIREATTWLKMSMRRQVHSSGLGQRMANTWRGDIYPRGQNSIRAAGLACATGQIAKADPFRRRRQALV